MRKRLPHPNARIETLAPVRPRVRDGSGPRVGVATATSFRSDKLAPAAVPNPIRSRNLLRESSLLMVFSADELWPLGTRRSHEFSSTRRSSRWPAQDIRILQEPDAACLFRHVPLRSTVRWIQVMPSKVRSRYGGFMRLTEKKERGSPAPLQRETNLEIK